jgi:hypothetical protein
MDWGGGGVSGAQALPTEPDRTNAPPESKTWGNCNNKTYRYPRGSWGGGGVPGANTLLIKGQRTLLCVRWWVVSATDHYCRFSGLRVVLGR